MRLRMIVTFLLACAPGPLFAQPAHLVIVAGAGSGSPRNLTDVNATLLFSASTSAAGTELSIAPPTSAMRRYTVAGQVLTRRRPHPGGRPVICPVVRTRAVVVVLPSVETPSP
jgi:hypothetical protein